MSCYINARENIHLKKDLLVLKQKHIQQQKILNKVIVLPNIMYMHIVQYAFNDEC